MRNLNGGSHADAAYYHGTREGPGCEEVTMMGGDQGAPEQRVMVQEDVSTRQIAG